MRFAKLSIIAITLFSIFSSVKSYAAFSCEQLIDPKGDYTAYEVSQLADTVYAKERFVFALGAFLNINLMEQGWSFKHLHGSTALGGVRDLQLEFSNNLPANRESLVGFVEKAKLDEKSIERINYNLAKVRLTIMGTEYAHGSVMGNQVREYSRFNFFINEDTHIESYMVDGSVFDAVISTHNKGQSGVRSRLTIEKFDDGSVQFTIYNEATGLRGLWNPNYTFVSNGLNWQDNPLKTTQTFSWFERLFLGYQNQTNPTP